MSSLDTIVAVAITKQTVFPSAKGFGIPLIVSYHTRYADIVRSFGSLSEMTAAGHSVNDPAYKAATAIFSQPVRPPSIVVGKRLLPSTQIVTMTPLKLTAGTQYTMTVTDPFGVATPVSYTVPAATVSTGASVTFAAGPKTITRAAGSWLTDGFTVGQTVVITGSTSNNQSAVISALSATVMTLGAATIVAEGPTSAAVFTGTINAVSIAAALAALIDPAANIIATATAGVVTSTTDVGLLANYSALPTPDVLSILDTSTDPGIATDLSNIETATNKTKGAISYYGLMIDHAAKTITLAAAAWVEARKIVFSARSSDSPCSDSSSTTDTMSLLKAAAYQRTFCLFAQDGTSDYRDAAWLGNQLPKDPGSNTWAFKTLSAVTVDALTDGQDSAIQAKNGNTYRTIAGVNITYEGKIASGDYIDNTIFVDWVSARVQETVFGGMVTKDKIPFTDPGIDVMVGYVQSVLDRGVLVGGFSANPAPIASAPKAATIALADKATRTLRQITFTGTLAGAIHKVIVNGTVTV